MLQRYGLQLRSVLGCSTRSFSASSGGLPVQASLPQAQPFGNVPKLRPANIVILKYPIAPQPVYINVSSLLPEHSSTGNVAILPPSVFRHPIRRDILHLCVNHYLDNQRQGTAATKSRGEVQGSGRKIRQQKGSGRARLGDGQSPMLRGGGHTFAKKARDFSTKLPRKVLQMGMRVLLSAKVRENALGVVEILDWPTAKTAELARRITSLGWQRTLLVTGADTVQETLMRASRALDGTETITAAQLTIHQGLKWERLILDYAAVDFFERTLGKQEIDVAAGLSGHVV
ncbi:hypothetical protein Clacol_008202 [Clathrus columnatus]|uniref:Large ribosomal subunit protein uL4m n=1 Tax=Clathrus columnatus TaxID=1419009 RepID=A0AAV5APW8_9AGAM|nr:hypothetical protein Clacol_008202 [Clathrus columnatus]